MTRRQAERLSGRLVLVRGYSYRPEGLTPAKIIGWQDGSVLVGWRDDREVHERVGWDLENRVLVARAVFFGDAQGCNRGWRADSGGVELLPIGAAVAPSRRRRARK